VRSEAGAEVARGASRLSETNQEEGVLPLQDIGPAQAQDTCPAQPIEQEAVIKEASFSPKEALQDLAIVCHMKDPLIVGLIAHLMACTLQVTSTKSSPFGK